MVRLDGAIRLDVPSPARAEIRQDVVEEYAEIYKEDREAANDPFARMPPVVLFFDGDNYWVGDGFQRTLAAITAGLSEIKADVRKGGQRDADLFALGCNEDHGARSSNADKRSKILWCFADPEWKNKSNREIARKCNISECLVRTVKAEQTEAGKYSRTGTVEGKDGKCYPAGSWNSSAQVRENTPGREPGDDSDSEREARAATRRNGKPIFQDRDIDEAFRVLCRLLTKREDVYGKHQKREACRQRLSEAFDLWGEWQRGTGSAVIFRGLPARLQPIFNDLPSFRSIERLLQQCIDQADELSKRPSGSHLRFVLQDVLRSIRDAKTEIRDSEPYAICPACKAEKEECKPCSNRGWIKRLQVKGFPDAQVEPVRLSDASSMA
jgi:hypothetical protein